MDRDFVRYEICANFHNFVIKLRIFAFLNPNINLYLQKMCDCSLEETIIIGIPFVFTLLGTITWKNRKTDILKVGLTFIKTMTSEEWKN